jgi:hypothetical protein
MSLEDVFKAGIDRITINNVVIRKEFIWRNRFIELI